MKEKTRQNLLAAAGGRNMVYVPMAIQEAELAPEFVTLAEATRLGAKNFKVQDAWTPFGQITAKWPDHYFADKV